MTEDAIFVAVRAYLLSILPAGVEVIQGQANRVPEPSSPDFLTIWAVNRQRLATNVDSWDTTAPPVAMTVSHSAQIHLQIDCHGPSASDNAWIVENFWRDDLACRVLGASGIQPLYATDSKQMPFINGEAQYENRWTFEIVLQAGLSLSTTAAFADRVVIVPTKV